jgi:N-acetylmuramoyl-L-alanine amidase
MLPDLPAPAIEPWSLPYESRLDERAASAIHGVVVHCTETPDLTLARTFGERVLYPSGTGNSGHWYIDRDGRVLQFVAAGRIAHHVRGLNDRTVGIELVNRGRWPNWLDAGHQAMDEPYTEPQIAALIALLQQLQRQLPNLRWIAGHEDLDRELTAASDDPQRQVPRKRDPGPLFPWARVLEAVRLQRVDADSVALGNDDSAR